jgi:hypothetical protein
MSRTMTRGGPRMIDPAERSLSVALRNDNRSFIWVRSNLSVMRGALDSGSRTRFTLGLSVQPSARLRLSLDPTLTNEREGAQYVASTGSVTFDPTYGRRYLFADLERRSLSVVTRANYTFTPNLTFELFAQGLISAGDYVGYKQLASPETFSFTSLQAGAYDEVGGIPSCLGGVTCESPLHRRHIDFDEDGAVDYAFTDRDFNLRSLRATAVLRWEYRPGSTIFFVWQRRQAGNSAAGDFDFGRDLSALWDASADDRFIVKVNLWLSS